MTYDVELPGGLWVDGRVERRACLRLITGHLERACTEADGSSRPERVSRQLAAAVEKIGGVSLSPELAGQLCVADRQFLMLRFAAEMIGDQQWISPACKGCHSDFDVEFRRSELPVIFAKNGYPFTTLCIGTRTVTLRAPTGADQQWLAEQQSSVTERCLLERCFTAVDDEVPAPGSVACMSAEDTDRMEAALDEMGPHVGTRLGAVCPECGEAQVVDVDPYVIQDRWRTELDWEVHTLAFHYHWSEADILAMPRQRRRRYLGYIDRERGVHG